LFRQFSFFSHHSTWDKSFRFFGLQFNFFRDSLLDRIAVKHSRGDYQQIPASGEHIHQQIPGPNVSGGSSIGVNSSCGIGDLAAGVGVRFGAKRVASKEIHPFQSQNIASAIAIERMNHSPTRSIKAQCSTPSTPNPNTISRMVEDLVPAFKLHPGIS
jgi:hypothetical protein